MDTVIKVMISLLIFLYTWLYQEQNQAWDVQRVLMKNAANLATHNAAQLAHRDGLGGGTMVIDPSAARELVLATMQANLGLDGSLIPVPGSPLQQPVTLVYLEVIDGTMATFPMLYENPAYGIAKYLRGPAVVAVIETPHPALIQGGVQQGPIRVPAVHEYVETQ